MESELEQYLNKCHCNYLEERKLVESQSLALGKHYDTWLITLSGGALLLSVTFIEKVIGTPPFWTLCLLAGAWCLLLFSLGFHLRAISRSQTGLNQKIETLDYEFAKLVSEIKGTSLSLSAPIETHEQCIKSARTLNSLSFWTFVLGILLLCIFSISNLPNIRRNGNCEDHRRIEMEDTDNKGKNSINESRGTFVGTPVAQPLPKPSSVTTNAGSSNDSSSSSASNGGDSSSDKAK